MPRFISGVTWFDDDEFIGSEITFPQLTPCRWRLERKVCEHEYCESETEARSPGGASEALAVYICSSLDGSSPREAIMKIRMQIPYRFTFTKPRSVRAKQATDTVSTLTRNEIEALQILTSNGCSSTPALFAWKQEKQGDEAWVPGGYAVFILMEKLPGRVVNNFYHDLEREERDELRKSFKDAWLECKRSGIINIDTGIRNILWDAERKKCYILDFEISRLSTARDDWYDELYISWNLAWVNQGNHDDMSTWEL